MRPRNLLAAASVLAAASAPAAIIVEQAPGRLTCTAPAGRFESRILASLAEGKRIAGRIRLLAAEGDSRWLPAAGFLFGTPRQRGSAGVQLILIPGDSDRLTAGLRVPNEVRPIGMGQVPAREWIPVSVSLSNAGRLEVAIADVTIRRRVRRRSGMVPFLMCNSGSFEFDLAPGVELSSDRFEQGR